MVGEPRIFVEVLRPIGGVYARSRIEISLYEWVMARHQNTIVANAINTALADVGWTPNHDDPDVP
jgi:hypothetical protein